MKDWKFLYTVLGAILTMPLIILTFLSMGSGHGTYLIYGAIFPTSAISIYFFEKIVTGFIILGFLQFPVYGLIIDLSKRKIIIASVLILFHSMLAFWIIPYCNAF